MKGGLCDPGCVSHRRRLGLDRRLNYLVNLLTALREHAADEMEPVLFCAPGVEPDTINSLRPFSG